MTRDPGDIVHVRTIRAEARRVGEHDLEITGQLVDQRPRGGPAWIDERGDPTVHDMTVTLRVRHPDLVITHVAAGMTERPYVICTEAMPTLDTLVGVSVAHGFTRAVNERLGRQNGCSHMTALIQAMGPVVRQAAGAAFGDEDRLPEPGDTPWFVNTCHAWRENGPLHRLVRAGDVSGMRAMSARIRRAGSQEP